MKNWYFAYFTMAKMMDISPTLNVDTTTTPNLSISIYHHSDEIDLVTVSLHIESLNNISKASKMLQKTPNEHLLRS